MAEAVASAYSKLYLYFYRRRDPRSYRPSPETMAVMEHLAATGPLTISETALHFDRSQSTVSELIERLVRRGLLQRISDERDRRRTLVWLSQKGREMLETERHVLNTTQVARALTLLTPTQREHLTTGLSALIEAAECAARSVETKPTRRKK